MLLKPAVDLCSTVEWLMMFGSLRWCCVEMPEFEACCRGSMGAWWRRITFCVMAAQKVDVTPKLPWEIDHSPVVNDISASPSWFSETKPCLINEVSSASGCKNLCETGKDKIAHVSMDLPHSKRIRRAACINIQVIKMTFTYLHRVMLLRFDPLWILLKRL